MKDARLFNIHLIGTKIMTVVVYTSSKKWCPRPSLNDKIEYHLRPYLGTLQHSCKAQKIVDRDLEAKIYRNASAHEVCFIKGTYTFDDAAKTYVDTVVGDIIRLIIALRYASSLNKEAKCHRPLMSKYVKYYLKFYLNTGEHTLLRHSCAAQAIADMDLKAGVYYRGAIFKMCWHGKYWDRDIARHFVDTHGTEISQTRFTRKFACRVHDGCLHKGVFYNNTEKQNKHLTCTFLEKRDRHRPPR